MLTDWQWTAKQHSMQQWQPEGSGDGNKINQQWNKNNN
jgi:hypothetical protein